ncbi:hypothetical protein [uncultured Roseovarius sp.]|uniref:hypothetical protein n=1 Tax=uncultured Roseovarius sp. TaxID=293344 RepID=UPI00260C9150|nr:hypothetical protein [uncultured Roseovarius sp.]
MIENTGQSPAYNVKFSIKVYLRDEGKNTDICAPYSKQTEIGSIGAQSEARQVLSVFGPLNHNGRIALKYSAQITFETVFSDLGIKRTNSSGSYTMVNIRSEGGGRQKVSVKNSGDES